MKCYLTNQKNEIGFHLSNDEANDNFEDVQDRMVELYDNLKFEKFELDNIETYQKAYEFGDINLFNEVKLICESVYEQNIAELEIGISEM